MGMDVDEGNQMTYDKNKIIYRCPRMEGCSQKKKCRALTTENRLERKLLLWIVCPREKDRTNGLSNEILVEVGGSR